MLVRYVSYNLSKPNGDQPDKLTKPPHANERTSSQNPPYANQQDKLTKP
jgi:hypothetical protein